MKTFCMIPFILLKLYTFSQILQGVHKLSSSTEYIYLFIYLFIYFIHNVFSYNAPAKL